MSLRDEQMGYGRFSKPVRHEAEVHRYPPQDNREVHRFLRHLEAAGCSLAPRYLGQAPDGAERLSYIAGVTGYPPLEDEVRSDAALTSVGRAIRRVHDASHGFAWALNVESGEQSTVKPRVIDCIGHHDLAPWNMVFDGTDVVGIIDWDTAGPSSRVWDLAYAAHQFVPFHQSADLAAWGWNTEPDRRARLRLLLASYAGSISPTELIDAAVLRLMATGAHIELQGLAGTPAFQQIYEDGHQVGYRNAAASLIGMRDSLL